MILYVNGDSHAAAAEAVNPHAFAEDDGRYYFMGRLPHPDNLAVSWGRLLSERLKAAFHYGCESASSNARIIRTTRDWIDKNPEKLARTLIVIGWSTWEREEWLIDDTYYQVNASGIDIVPKAHKKRYKEYVATVNWAEKTQQAHNDIWAFHNELNDQNIKHIFFNGNTNFAQISDKKDWGISYIDPYDAKMTYDAILRSNGFDTVSPNSYHFGKEAHSFWSQFVLKYILKHHLY